jgi:hypothetical protein
VSASPTPPSRPELNQTDMAPGPAHSALVDRATSSRRKLKVSFPEGIHRPGREAAASVRGADRSGSRGVFQALADSALRADSPVDERWKTGFIRPLPTGGEIAEGPFILLPVEGEGPDVHGSVRSLVVEVAPLHPVTLEADACVATSAAIDSAPAGENGDESFGRLRLDRGIRAPNAQIRGYFVTYDNGISG